MLPLRVRVVLFCILPLLVGAFIPKRAVAQTSDSYAAAWRKLNTEERQAVTFGVLQGLGSAALVVQLYSAVFEAAARKEGNEDLAARFKSVTPAITSKIGEMTNPDLDPESVTLAVDRLYGDSANSCLPIGLAVYLAAERLRRGLAAPMAELDIWRKQYGCEPLPDAEIHARGSAILLDMARATVTRTVSVSNERKREFPRLPTTGVLG